MTQAVDISRRNLLKGRPVSDAAPIRPPGAISESQFIEACTACDECIRSCPEGIIISGAAGYPEVDFRRGECTFCGDCSSVCPESVLLPGREPPWQLQLLVKDNCLAKKRVVCQTCGDVCDQTAIRFRPRIGDVAIPEVQQADCNGCGACVSACPENALELKTIQPTHSAKGVDQRA